MWQQKLKYKYFISKIVDMNTSLLQIEEYDDREYYE